MSWEQMMTGREAPIRVLIADDDPAVLDDYAKALADPIADTSQTKNALDALEADLFGEADPTPAPAEPCFETVICKQGEAALAAHEEAATTAHAFHVALIDVRMPPGIDGIETAMRMRASDDRILIGIVTGQADVDFREIARRVLPSDKVFFVRKPFLSSEMRANVIDEVRRLRGSLPAGQ